MKNLFISVVFIICATLVFAGGQEDTGGNESVTVKYAFWGNPDAIGVEQEIIDAFEQSNGMINIEPVVSGYGEYHTKLLTLLAGGLAPDVMRIDSYYFQDFTSLNALKPLDELVKRDNLDMSIYYQQGIQENTYEGTLYGFPWATAALYMLINLDVLEMGGLELPSMDWTMDDFISILEKYEDMEDIYGFATSVSGISDMLPYIWANGGDAFSADRKDFAMNRPDAVEALDRMATLYQRGLMPRDSITADADTLNRWFINNKIAMRMGAASEILSLQKVEGVRFEAWSMPGDKVKNTTIFKSNIVGINANTKVPEEAWTFLKFLRGPEGQGETLYMQAKRIPPTIDDQKYWTIYADPEKYPRMIEENSRKIAEIYGHTLPIRPGWLEVNQLVGSAFQQIFLGDKTAKTAMDEITPKVQSVLDRTVK